MEKNICIYTCVCVCITKSPCCKADINILNPAYFNKKLKNKCPDILFQSTINTPYQVSSHPPPNTKWCGEGDWFHRVPHELFCTILPSLNMIYKIIARIKF